MTDTYSLPHDAAMMELNPTLPYSALEILRNAGHEELGREFAKACETLNRCSQAFMAMHLESGLSPYEFSEMLRQNAGFQSAKQAKDDVWMRIERLRDEPPVRIFHRTPKL